MVCSLRPGKESMPLSRHRRQTFGSLAWRTKGDIEPHDAEPDYADFVYSVNHETSLRSIRLYPRYHRRWVNSMSFKIFALT